MDNGGGGGGVGGGFNHFCFPLQQQTMMQQYQLMRNQYLGSNHLQVVPSSSMASSPTLNLEVEKQRYEIDRFLALQNERLRLVLQEQRKQQLAIILKRLESKALNLLRQKDEDIARAAKRTMDLEDCLRRTEMENQEWQRIAKENEAMVITLNNTFEQVRENYCCFSCGVEDAESCCEVSHGFKFNNKEQERAGEVGRDDDDDDDEEEMRKMGCKGCKSRSSCVIFLPCRHLCSCKSCEAFLDCCPVCKSVKKASIEVLS